MSSHWEIEQVKAIMREWMDTTTQRGDQGFKEADDAYLMLVLLRGAVEGHFVRVVSPSVVIAWVRNYVPDETSILLSTAITSILLVIYTPGMRIIDSLRSEVSWPVLALLLLGAFHLLLSMVQAWEFAYYELPVVLFRETNDEMREVRLKLARFDTKKKGFAGIMKAGVKGVIDKSAEAVNATMNIVAKPALGVLQVADGMLHMATASEGKPLVAMYKS